MNVIAEPLTLADLPAHKMCGFDCYLMSPRQTQYPVECMTGTDLTVIPLHECERLVWDMGMEDESHEAWANGGLIFEAESPDGWTYLFPVTSYFMLEQLDDNLKDLQSEIRHE